MSPSAATRVAALPPSLTQGTPTSTGVASPSGAPNAAQPALEALDTPPLASSRRWRRRDSAALSGGGALSTSTADHGSATASICLRAGGSLLLGDAPSRHSRASSLPSCLWPRAMLAAPGQADMPGGRDSSNGASHLRHASSRRRGSTILSAAIPLADPRGPASGHAAGSPGCHPATPWVPQQLLPAPGNVVRAGRQPPPPPPPVQEHKPPLSRHRHSVSLHASASGDGASPRGILSAHWMAPPWLSSSFDPSPSTPPPVSPAAGPTAALGGVTAFVAPSAAPISGASVLGEVHEPARAGVASHGRRAPPLVGHVHPQASGLQALLERESPMHTALRRRRSSLAEAGGRLEVALGGAGKLALGASSAGCSNHLDGAGPSGRLGVHWGPGS